MDVQGLLRETALNRLRTLMLTSRKLADEAEGFSKRLFAGNGSGAGGGAGGAGGGAGGSSGDPHADGRAALEEAAEQARLLGGAFEAAAPRVLASMGASEEEVEKAAASLRDDDKGKGAGAAAAAAAAAAAGAEGAGGATAGKNGVALAERDLEEDEEERGEGAGEHAGDSDDRRALATPKTGGAGSGGTFSAGPVASPSKSREGGRSPATAKAAQQQEEEDEEEEQEEEALKGGGGAKRSSRGKGKGGVGGGGKGASAAAAAAAAASKEGGEGGVEEEDDEATQTASGLPSTRTRGATTPKSPTVAATATSPGYALRDRSKPPAFAGPTAAAGRGRGGGGRGAAAALKPKAPIAKTTKPKQQQPAAKTSASDEEFEVKKIVSSKVERGRKLYKIRWAGYKPKNDTWEPEANLKNNTVFKTWIKKQK